MSKRFLSAVRVVLVIGAVAAIAGAASPAGHAKGISYHSLNKIQKRLISGSLAMSLVGATPAAKSAETATCGNGENGGDEPDEAPSVSARQLLARSGPGGGGGQARTTRLPATTAARRTAVTTSRSTRSA